MKSARSLATGWIHQLPLERRSVLVTALVLVVMLSSVVLYARWRDGMAPASEDLTAGAAASGTLGAGTAGAGTSTAGAAASRTEAAGIPPSGTTAVWTGGDAAAGQADSGALPRGSHSPEDASPTAQGNTASEAVAAQEALAEPVELAFPLSGEPEVLQAYEFAFSPLYEDYRLHPGIDFAAAEGQAVLAAAPGKVVSVETDLEAGMAVVVDHGGGLMTRYAGLGQVQVRPEARVAQGTRLGTIRKPVDGAQPFLHFEVLEDGDPVDPSTYLFQ